MNFEQPNLQPVKGVPEEGEFKERLSVDYGFIRDAALRLVGKKELGAKSPDLEKLEEARAKLADDQFVLDFARANKWQEIRDYSEDLEEEDRILAKKLADFALGMQ